MIKIQVDGKNYEVEPKKNLLETCLAIGLDIPHFCFHPALGSVGACRLCAVKKYKDADDKKGPDCYVLYGTCCRRNYYLN